MPETPTKLCKDCRWVVGPHHPDDIPDKWMWECSVVPRPVLADYVFGVPVRARHDRCLYVRDDARRCGPEGKWWEPVGDIGFGDRS